MPRSPETAVLLLAIVGVHGVSSLVIRQRRREVAIRLAMGASRRLVLRCLLIDALRPVGIGAVAGALLAFVAGHWLSGILFGVRPFDPAAVGSALLIVAVSAIVAVVSAARSAMILDPSAVLREE